MGIRALTTAQKKELARHLGSKQTQTKWNSYYSRVRFTADTLAANVYSLAAGGYVQAFGYGRNQDMAAAGLAGVRATPADTNILTANQTIAGEMVLIEGVSIIMLAQSDANFAKRLDQTVSVKIKTNGTTEYLLGIPSMVPGCGGLFGSSEAWSVTPSIPDALSRSVGALSNGIPHSSNFMPLPEPMLWSSAGKGDSTFNVELKVEYAAATIAQFGSAARSAIADYQQAYTPPTAAQTFVDYMIVLVGCTVNPLSSY
jgi:hypothetical protein